MTKYPAFNAELDIGTPQVETAVVVGTITGDGNATFTVTAAGMTGSPKAKSVAVLTGDTADTVATKAIAVLAADSDITDMFDVYGSGPNVVLRRKIGAANDATLNIAYTNDTCTGLTPDATSNDTVAGVAAVEVAGVTNIGGPNLGLDVEDVTTHDQTTAFEEVVATILRSGEVTLDIVYDPAGATHDASTGLVYRLEDQVFSAFDLIFVSTYNWRFNGYVVGFEPTGPVAGELGATVKIKITGAPTLE
jgi:phage tail sheath gpL-like